MRGWAVFLLLLASACTPARPPAPPTLTPPPVMLELPPPPGATVVAQPEGSPTAVVAEEPTPTPWPIDPTEQASETEALAAVPLEAPAQPAEQARGTPTPVALPPSARLVIALTPTPNVAASSPVLAAAPTVSGIDYARAIKLVQDSRRGDGPRLEDRIARLVERAKASGSEVELLGWDASLKGSAEVYRVTFALRENRQLLLAEWEVDLRRQSVRPMNAIAEGLSAL
ncbi:MAG TPA: hypothetical protein VKZ60_17095 [Chloroflexota bacterium]|nr:hypothetical protein [Chloroflexota bacterium]